MNARNVATNKAVRYMDAQTLAAYLSLGVITAREVGTKAGARRQIGRRVVFDREKVDAYMDKMCSGEDQA